SCSYCVFLCSHSRYPRDLHSFPTRRSSDLFIQGDGFAVHILSAGQQELSGKFARSGSDKFAGLDVGRGRGDIPLLDGCTARFERSEEHTSELQSRENLVCRLLLEKKNIKQH